MITSSFPIAWLDLAMSDTIRYHVCAYVKLAVEKYLALCPLLKATTFMCGRELWDPVFATQLFSELGCLNFGILYPLLVG